MLKKILSFSNPCHLSAKLEQLVIYLKEEQKEITRPLEDIGFVLLDHPQITCTQAVLQLLAENNIAVVVCDSRHHPASMLLHLDVHHIQAERFRHQVAASEPLRKNCWMQTIRAKINNQAAVLTQAGKDAKPLLHFAKNVSSGDPANLEGQAARYYFKTLFGDSFIRDRFGIPPNPSLNYGYAIIRAAVARALVASGLLPTLGIHHHNKYNSFALADDIMEPYRPFVDQLVFEQVQTIADYHYINTERKAAFLSLLQQPCDTGGERSPLMVAMSYTTASLAKCFEGKTKKLVFPGLLNHA